VTGIGRPSSALLASLVRLSKPDTAMFGDDGEIPNNPRLPLVHYRSAVRLIPHQDPAAVFEGLFESNGWTDSWRNGIYDLRPLPFRHP
jgi:uncharacterized protein YjlB